MKDQVCRASRDLRIGRWCNVNSCEEVAILCLQVGGFNSQRAISLCEMHAYQMSTSISIELVKRQEGRQEKNP